jgi:hypothetical protein
MFTPDEIGRRRRPAEAVSPARDPAPDPLVAMAKAMQEMAETMRAMRAPAAPPAPEPVAPAEPRVVERIVHVPQVIERPAAPGPTQVSARVERDRQGRAEGLTLTAPGMQPLRGAIERDQRGRMETLVIRSPDGRAVRMRIERDHAGGFVGFTTSQE